MDTITKQRIVDATAVLVGFGRSEVPEMSDEETKAIISKGIDADYPEMMELVSRVQSIVAAYYGATDLDTEVTARAMIELIANTNKAKRFILPILEGPGVGHWEMIVRRVREEKPSLVIPTMAEKEKLW